MSKSSQGENGIFLSQWILVAYFHQSKYQDQEDNMTKMILVYISWALYPSCVTTYSTEFLSWLWWYLVILWNVGQYPVTELSLQNFCFDCSKCNIGEYFGIQSSPQSSYFDCSKCNIKQYFVIQPSPQNVCFYCRNIKKYFVI